MKFLRILLIFTASTQSMAQELIIEEKVKFLALGDSYTIGESVTLKERWPEQLIDSLRKRGLDCFDPKIIATTGWRTDNLKNAITAGSLKPEYNLVALLIGVNNYYQGKSVDSYAPEFEDLLNTAIGLAGGIKSHVFVVSIPDYGYTPFGKSNQATISKGIDAYNAVNESIAQALGVKYFYITDISRRGLNEPELVAGDGLHPSGRMYSEWVGRILKGAVIRPSDDSGNNDDNTDDTVTGIQDEAYSMRVYPNPFDRFIQVENIPAYPDGVFVKLHSSIGSEIVIHNLDQNTKTIKIDTEKLASGKYIFSVTPAHAGRPSLTLNLIKL